MAEFTPPAFGTPGRGAGGQFAKGNVFGQGALGFGVGIPEFLDSQESKVARYYRGLEFGSIKFVGTRIFGLFGTGSRLDFKGGELFAPGRGTGQQFFPLGYISGFLPGGGTATAKALRYLRENGGSKTHGSNLEVLIKNPIEAQNAYRDAFKSFDAPEKEKAAVLQILGGLINGENARWRRGMSRGSDRVAGVHAGRPHRRARDAESLRHRQPRAPTPHRRERARHARGRRRRGCGGTARRW